MYDIISVETHVWKTASVVLQSEQTFGFGLEADERGELVPGL